MSESEGSSADENAEIERLSRKIAETTEAIQEIKAGRARVESSVVTAPSREEPREIDVLREKVARGRARLDELKEMKRVRDGSTESTVRSSYTFAGLAVALPGTTGALFLLRDHFVHPEQATDPMLFALTGLPALLGFALVIRARVAKFDPKTQDIGEDSP